MSLSNEIGEWVDHALCSFGLGLAAQAFGDDEDAAAIDLSTRVCIHETPEAYRIEVDVAGLDKDKLQIHLKNLTLSVEGERFVPSLKEHSCDEATLNIPLQNNPNISQETQEASRCPFQRLVSLPSNANTEALQAKLEGERLILTIERFSTQDCGRAIQINPEQNA